MPLALYRELDIRDPGFGMKTDPGLGMKTEVTGKLLKRGGRPVRGPISYPGREESKKITGKDGVEALWILSEIRARPAAPRA
jgi:dolichol-phosphate hexosyltransferase